MAQGRFDVNDDLASVVRIGDMLNSFFCSPSDSTIFYKGRIVNEDEYDIIPKKSKIEKDIKAKEAELSQVEQRKKNEDQYYDSKIKSIKLEIDQLKRKISP